MKLRSLPCRQMAVWLIVFMTMIALTATTKVNAQMPDCLSNTYMYMVVSPKQNINAEPPYDSTEIREVSFATGAVGQLMGGRRYYIAKKPASSCGSCPVYFGSSAMGLDPVFGRFYLITQMGSGGSGSSTAYGDKDIIMIDPLAPTATGTVIGTINDVPDGAGGPTNMDNYHFVKAAVSPNGWGYAVGVNRSSGASSGTFNPIIRFSLCATAGCSTIQLIGYISNDNAISRGMELFNGDITFDAAGNMYFFASAYSTSVNKYTHSRLFRINASDLPGSPGSGEIPMQFLADYDNIDSTGASGLVMSGNGNIYLTLRHYDYSVTPNIVTNRLYASYDTSSTLHMTGFGPIDDTLSAGDLASCYFPAAILPHSYTKLSARYAGGSTALKWDVADNSSVSYYELQVSDDGDNFNTLNTIYPSNGAQDKASYNYTHAYVNGTQKYYRVQKVLKSSPMRLYSNVVKVALDGRLNIVMKPSPNPFTGSVKFEVELKSSGNVTARLLDQGGRAVFTRNYNGNAGVNSFNLDGLSGIKNGIYILEVSSGDAVIREKLIKQ